jgi:hypothetical protein
MLKNSKECCQGVFLRASGQAKKRVLAKEEGKEKQGQAILDHKI